MNWDKEIEGFKEYLKLEKNLTSNSIHAYETDLKKLVSFLDEKGYKIGPEDIKLSHLKELTGGQHPPCAIPVKRKLAGGFDM